MRMIRFAYLIGILALLGACTTDTFIEKHRIPTPYVETPDKAAYLVGSIGYSTADEVRRPASSSWVAFRQKGSELIGTLRIESSLRFGEYEEDDRLGKVFAIPLKPGEYEIVNVGFWYWSAVYEKTFWGKDEFSVPFTIEAKKAYYVGEFLAFGQWGKILSGRQFRSAANSCTAPIWSATGT